MKDRTLVPLLGLVGLLLFIMGAVVTRQAAPPAIASFLHGAPDLGRELFFEDTAQGYITVLDAASGREIASLPPGSNGFVRATLRGLARERRQSEQGAERPFRVAAWTDGRVVLTDMATGREVDLLAFGTTNAEAFSRFLRN